MCSCCIRIVLVACSATIATAWSRCRPEAFQQHRKGEQRLCLGGRPHRLRFSTLGAVDDMFVALNSDLVSEVDCDIDKTQLQLHMKSAAAVKSFVNQIETKQQAYGTAFLTGTGRNGTVACKNTTKPLLPAAPDVNVTSACNALHDCESCLKFQPYCNFCPLGGKVECGNDVFLTTRCHFPWTCIGPKCDKKTCPAPPQVTPRGYVLRRVLDYEVDASKNIVTLHAVEVKYDEVFSDGNITVDRDLDKDECDGYGGPGPTPVFPGSKWCLGVNVMADPDDPSSFCKASAGNIPIFDQSIGPADFSIDCTNCFIGYTWDFVFHLKIKRFKMQEIAFGFKNMRALGSLELTMVAEGTETIAVNKQLDVLPGGAADVAFTIGVVPFHATLDIPVNVDGTFTFQATGKSVASMTFFGNYGDNFKTWKAGAGWNHVKTTPVFDTNQTIQGSKQWQGQLDFSMNPQILYAMDNIFTYNYADSHTYHSDMEWDDTSQQLCSHASSKAHAQEVAKLGINVDWIHIALAKQWGPYVLMDWSKVLKDNCTNATNEVVFSV